MNVPASAPDLAAFKEWVGIEADDDQDDALIQQSLDAAIAAQARVVAYPCGEDGVAYFDPDLYEAILLRTQRLNARRNSPEGVIGITGTGGDFVAARLTSNDPDIIRLECVHYKMVVS